MVEPKFLDEPHAERCRLETLKHAFAVFNQLSATLTDSYRELESQVVRLTQELAAARSERLKALVEKERLANRLGYLLEVLPGGVIVLDGAGRIVECNPKAAELLGEPLGGEDWAAVSRRSFESSGNNPHEWRLKNGRTVNISARPLGEESGQILLLADITEMRTLQELLDQHRRLAAMGEMVARLAHQVRTPLAATILYATQLKGARLEKKRRLVLAHKLTERLHALERQVSDLLAFARRGELAMAEIPVAELLRCFAEAAEAKLTAKASLRYIDLTGGAKLWGNAEALLGALLNLLANAIEAGAGQIEVKAAYAGDRLCLSVIDDGQGMEEAVHKRMFEPFFTTRPNGTGLGLAVVDSVVKAHGGYIRCNTAPGQGTAFHVYLPSAVEDIPLPGGYRQVIG